VVMATGSCLPVVHLGHVCFAIASQCKMSC